MLATTSNPNIQLRKLPHGDKLYFSLEAILTEFLKKEIPTPAFDHDITWGRVEFRGNQDKRLMFIYSGIALKEPTVYKPHILWMEYTSKFPVPIYKRYIFFRAMGGDIIMLGSQTYRAAQVPTITITRDGIPHEPILRQLLLDIGTAQWKEPQHKPIEIRINAL